MNKRIEKSKALGSDELEKITGGKAPNISLDQARKYFENGVKSHMEMQAIYYYKAFCSQFSTAECQKMKMDFAARFGHELTDSKYYSIL